MTSTRVQREIRKEKFFCVSCWKSEVYYFVVCCFFGREKFLLLAMPPHTRSISAAWPAGQAAAAVRSLSAPPTLLRFLCSTSCIPNVCVNIVDNEWNAKKYSIYTH